LVDLSGADKACLTVLSLTVAGFTGTRDALGATSIVGSELKMCGGPEEDALQAKEAKSCLL